MGHQKLVSVFIFILAGILASLAHPFQYEDLVHLSSWWSIMIGSIGWALAFWNLEQDKIDPKKAGFLFGVAYFTTLLWWIAFTLIKYGEIHFIPSTFILLIFCSFLALFYGGAFYLSRLYRDSRLLVRALQFALAITVIESIRESIFTGFTWGQPGHAFAFSPLIARTSSLWGTHGLTFLWLSLITPLLTIKFIYKERATQFFYAALVIIIAAGAAGTSPENSGEKNSYKIALIQPNVDQGIKWDSRLAQNHLDRLVGLSDAAVNGPDKAQLVIWPETAYPYMWANAEVRASFKLSSPTILGSVVREHGINRNSALLFVEQMLVGRYDKTHLVPFGEYIPFEDWIPKWLPIQKLVANAGNFKSGENNQPPLRPFGDELRLGTLICYEDIFSKHAVWAAKNGANVLLNLTNDGWYDGTSALWQHAQISSLMSYQTGLPLLRATNTGISLVAKHDGPEIFKPYEESYAIAEVDVVKNPEQTFFVKTFPLMQWIWLLLFVIALVWKKQKTNEK